MVTVQLRTSEASVSNNDDMYSQRSALVGKLNCGHDVNIHRETSKAKMKKQERRDTVDRLTRKRAATLEHSVFVVWFSSRQKYSPLTRQKQQTLHTTENPSPKNKRRSLLSLGSNQKPSGCLDLAVITAERATNCATED
jgi:hypothetical protein